MGGKHIGLDTSSSLVYVNQEHRLIVTIGVNDLVVVDTGDVLLVCRKEQAQKVRQVVRSIENRAGKNTYKGVSPLEAYCVKCKTKREVNNPEPVFTDAGQPATRGICSVCGANIYRMGKTEAHQALDASSGNGGRRSRRSGKLVIVESPAKARTVGRFLGKEYTVKASVGHVRDLLRSQLSVDVENNFNPKYRVPNEKRAVVKELKSLAKKSEEVYSSHRSGPGR